MPPSRPPPGPPSELPPELPPGPPPELSSEPPSEPPSGRRPRLLVTRPADRQEPFGRRARALGVDTLPFPCLAIRADPDARLPDAASLAALGAVLFTSRPAVEAAALLRAFPWPGVTALAIGPASAGALDRAGQPLAREPAPPFTSEALLDALERAPPLPSVLLVKGHGGRDVLERRLAERGTRVETLALYRRVRPSPSPASRRRAFGEPGADIVSATSDEGLENLVALAGPDRARLLTLPLIVNSERGAGRARALGFRGAVRVASPAGDEGQLAALGDWLAARSAERPEV